MTLYTWSKTAASDATADSTINWAEGQAPSSVNDSARAMMAAIAKYRDDNSGATITTGTSTDYIVASKQVFDTLGHMDGQVVAFSPHATNTGTTTLNVDTFGNFPLRAAPNVELLPGTIIQGTPYAATYKNADGVWYLHGFYGNPYSVPIFGGMDYWDTIAPNSSFIFPAGQAISRTTYSVAFARWGTTFGAGNGSTTFNVPDKTGRVSAMIEGSATRLTATYFGGNSTGIGGNGGAESRTILTGNLPPYTPAGSASVTSTISNILSGSIQTINAATTGSQAYKVIDTTNGVSTAVTSTGTITGTAQGGVSAPIATVQPTIVTNYIIRII